MRAILEYPNPLLRQASRPVEAVTDEVRRLVADMVEAMRDADGAGLAAIQVGEPIRLFLLEVETVGEAAPTQADTPVVFINPVIIDLSAEAETADEGCLSFPTIVVSVRRAQRVTVEAMDLDGQAFRRELSGFASRAIQHETEHLDGKLLIDHVGPVRRDMIKKKLAKRRSAR